MKATAVERKLAYMLRAAVIDAQHVEKLANEAVVLDKRPSMALDMMTFVKRDGDVCYMCLGGARAILGLGADPDVPDYSKWSEKARSTARAVDSMREGDFHKAAAKLNYPVGGLSISKGYRAAAIVDEGYKEELSRASWEDYLRAACVLLGEEDPGASA